MCCDCYRANEDMLFTDSACSTLKIRDWLVENDVKDRAQR